MHLIERYPRTYRHKRCTVRIIDLAGIKYCVWGADDSLIGYADSLREAAELIETEANNVH